MLQSIHPISRVKKPVHSSWRHHFPALNSQNHHTAYLDSASSCQLPQTVIDAIGQYLTAGHGNAQRGMYPFSENASRITQQCREKTADFIHAASADNIIFSPSATAAINMVALGLQQQVCARQSILITAMEHHANLLPWQRLCQQTGARLNILNSDQHGHIDISQLDEYLNDNCALFAMCHISNVTGIKNDVAHWCQRAKSLNVTTLVDGAQAVGHQAVDVSLLNTDYYVFSAHKMYGPTGIGVLYANNQALGQLKPMLLGGGIVNKVTRQAHSLKAGVAQFEAGSANMLGIVGLSSAIDFIEQIGWQQITSHQQQLSDALHQALSGFEQITLLPNNHLGNVLSFVHNSVHSHDVASILASHHVSVRAGHHCAQPYLQALGVKHCARVSLACYNNLTDIDQLVEGLQQIERQFSF